MENDNYSSVDSSYSIFNTVLNTARKNESNEMFRNDSTIHRKKKKKDRNIILKLRP